MALARVETTGGAILYDPRRIELPGPSDFEPAALAHAGRVVGHASGRGQVWFLTPRPRAGDGVQWVLRHYRRGGMVARLSRDRYLYTTQRRTRSFAELTLLDELSEAGLPVPAPVAARYERSGPFYRADLITLAIAGTRTFAQLCIGDVPVDSESARAVGQAVRRLHDAGIWHADLNAHNVLLDAQSRAWIIDFDRAVRRAPGPWTGGNLDRLHRSLAKVHGARGVVLPAALWPAVLDGYAGGA